MSWKGHFHPKYPEKYCGNVKDIIYRSKIEFRFMRILDESVDVINWASEEFHIEYMDKTTNRVRRYFPDFLYKTKRNETYLIEIKSHEETIKPVLVEGKSKKKYERDMITWMKNQCKWEAAKQWCEKKGYKFLVINEKQLGMKY